MNTPNATAAPRIGEAVRAAITGKVFLPGEPGCDQARQAWNLAVDERPRPSEMVSWPEGG